MSMFDIGDIVEVVDVTGIISTQQQDALKLGMLATVLDFHQSARFSQEIFVDVILENNIVVRNSFEKRFKKIINNV